MRDAPIQHVATVSVVIGVVVVVALNLLSSSPQVPAEPPTQLCAGIVCGPLTTADWLLVGGSFVATVLIGLYVTRPGRGDPQ
jgi:hypothetical protein